MTATLERRPQENNLLHPPIIQGGMGIGVSNWKLARAVSLTGQLGVVSGTLMDTVIIRRLQDGDTDGAVRRALSHFPNAAIADEIIAHYYLEGGRKPDQPYKVLPLPTEQNNPLRDKIAVAGGFVEVFLAKEGHSGRVGMNLLTKIQHSNLPILYGAMLAGVDYILMGAGIPKDIPAILQQLALHHPVKIKLDVEELPSSPYPETWITFDPSIIAPPSPLVLKRPYFFPIISSHSLALMLSRKASGPVDGFIVEGPRAGGHNAPPRGGLNLGDNGEPLYGERDEVDLRVMRSIGLPFWLAGGMASPERLAFARQQGASGIQVGTLFALCQESGFTPEIKEKILESLLNDTYKVVTDPYASPTGFPFKIVSMPGSLSETEVHQQRTRYCDLGYLRSAYRQADGRLKFSCAGAPQSKSADQTSPERIRCQCLCNALLAAVGLPQYRQGGNVEPPLVTGSQDAQQLKPFLATVMDAHFRAEQAVEYLLS